MIIYTNPSSSPRTQTVHLPGYATAQDFPRHLHSKRKVQIQAYSGHKGDCMRPFCIWMHFSLLRDENNTSSAFYSFIHILLLFYLSYKLMRAILKILEILKEKIKGNKKKMRESENLHFKLLPNSSPNNTFCLGGKLQIPNEISHCMNFCIKYFWVAAFPKCQSINTTSWILKFKFRTIFCANDQTRFCPSFTRKLHSMCLHLHKSTQVQDYSFLDANSKGQCLENQTRAQAGGLTWARRLNSKNPINYSWRYISITKLAFPWFPLQINCLSKPAFSKKNSLLLYQMQRHPWPLSLP